MIVSGMLRPGMVLEGEVEASDQRKVSRSAYREAVRILVAKGLVHSKPKAGTRVNDRTAWHLLDPDVLSWIFQIEPDYTLVYSLFEMRNMVEPEAAALAAERRNPAKSKPWRPRLRSCRGIRRPPRNGATRTSSFTPRCWKRRAMPFLPR